MKRNYARISLDDQPLRVAPDPTKEPQIKELDKKINEVRGTWGSMRHGAISYDTMCCVLIRSHVHVPDERQHQDTPDTDGNAR